MALRRVIVEINQQQAQLLDRLKADGHYGQTYGDIVRAGFVRFCEQHPEFLKSTDESAR